MSGSAMDGTSGGGLSADVRVAAAACPGIGPQLPDAWGSGKTDSTDWLPGWNGWRESGAERWFGGAEGCTTFKNILIHLAGSNIWPTKPPEAMSRMPRCSVSPARKAV